MQSLAQLLWQMAQILIGYNLVLPIALFMAYLLIGFLNNKKPVSATNSDIDYAIIVTAYQQTTFLPQVVASLLQLRHTNYIIYLVADNCNTSALQFNDNRVVVLKPPTILASNTKSHFYAIDNFVRNHTHLTIIDSDNLVEPNYLNELNTFFAKGYHAVQGIRNPKNLNSTYACLDAARDIYYHFYDGQVLFALGSSATLSGSGMAFTVELYKKCLGNKPVAGAGFDKVLQYEILSRGYRIAFNKNAIVYDEKTAKADQLVNQRARWINTWFKYFGLGFSLLYKGLKNASINQILFAIILLRPPLFMFLLSGILFTIINIFIAPLSAIYWVACFLCFIISFLLALLLSPTDKRIYASLANIPKFMFLQVVSLLNARHANKRSVATVHTFEDNEKLKQ
jgi:cellulose synthase/poly-beta-1,6-N-acetylglucosamine synthase-like glycosyltransferase